MEQRKSDDTEDPGETGPTRIREHVDGQVTGYGGTCRYSYHLVYTQESLRVLDMRSIPIDAECVRLVRGILRARARGAGYREEDTIGLYGEVRLKDS